MVRVALAGASSGSGLTILQAILTTQKHDVVLLSRQPQPELSAQGVDVRPVDYTSHDDLVNALQGCHTVISTLGGSGEVLEKAQLALIAAAKEAGVKRFAPSEFAHSTYDDVDVYAGKGKVWEAVKNSGMEYTRFAVGLFMNFLATGTPEDETFALAGMRPWSFCVNVKAGTADLPGDGNAKLSVIDIRDVGRFVAAALELDEWEEESSMVGETLTFNEIVEKAERATGRTFLKRYNDLDEMRAKAEDPNQRFYNQVRISIAEGRFAMKPVLNKRFPEIKPTPVDEFLNRYWAGVTDLPKPSWGEDAIFAFE